MRKICTFLTASLAALALVGCSSDPPKPVPSTQPLVRYPTLPAKKYPDYLKGTIAELCDMGNSEPELISGYGLVVNLQPGTGDTKAPQVVREYMINEMAKRGFGSALIPDFKDMTPERVLSDPARRVAIVEVYGYLPPGVREGQMFDVQVAALSGNDTTSLAHGSLYRCDLRENGANTINPLGAIYVKGRCQGDIFINPALALSTNQTNNTIRASKRTGWILDGGEALTDRPIVMRLRSPQWSVSRRISRRIAEFFQDSDTIAAASYDEALVNMIVPKTFKGDWQHFVGVATHLYLINNPGDVPRRAKALADAAVKPDAPLKDISFAFEGLGAEALPFITPLMESKNADVAFAATRAAAFLGDQSAIQNLVKIAKTAQHPFQINAVEVLGAMPNTPSISSKLRELLNVDQAKVRIEAYRVLAANHDPAIYSQVINEKFVLDIVPSSGAPMIWASRRGTPRIAIFGPRPSIETPITFTTLNDNLMFSSVMDDQAVMLYYRGIDVPRDPKTHLARPIKIISRPDVAEIVGWLGGLTTRESFDRMNFSYADITAILQSLADSHHITAGPVSRRIDTSFVLQEVPGMDDKLIGAPPLVTSARPQADPNASAAAPTAPAVSGSGQ